MFSVDDILGDMNSAWWSGGGGGGGGGINQDLGPEQNKHGHKR